MINRVVLVGRLTRDVEVRKTTSGISVASFTVACDRPRSRDNQGQSSADFISCVAWRQPADFLGQYARKGAMIGVDGRIQTRNYQDRDGKTVYVTEVVADNVRLLESRGQSEARDSANYGGGYGNNYGGGYGEPANAYSSPAGDSFSDGFNTGPSLDISSDDLPF